MNLEERFWSKVNIKGEDDCWNWNAGLDTAGYGAFKYNGKKYDSNRMTWFIVHGEFPELLVCHTCDNRLCCNPKHLFLGTYLDNAIDMKNKGRVAIGKNHGTHVHPDSLVRGENHHLSIYTDKEIEKILIDYFYNDLSKREISKKHGVSIKYIGQLVNRECRTDIYDRVVNK